MAVLDGTHLKNAAVDFRQDDAPDVCGVLAERMSRRDSRALADLAGVVGWNENLVEIEDAVITLCEPAHSLVTTGQPLFWCQTVGDDPDETVAQTKSSFPKGGDGNGVKGDLLTVFGDVVADLIANATGWGDDEEKEGSDAFRHVDVLLFGLLGLVGLADIVRGGSEDQMNRTWGCFCEII